MGNIITLLAGAYMLFAVCMLTLLCLEAEHPTPRDVALFMIGTLLWPVTLLAYLVLALKMNSWKL